MKNTNNKNLIISLIVLVFVFTFSFAPKTQAYGEVYSVQTGITYSGGNNTEGFWYNPNATQPAPSYTTTTVKANTGTSNPVTSFNDTIVTNPSPIIYSISPDTVNVGSKNVIVNITGVNFIPSSIVRLDISNKTTSYIDSKHLSLILNDSDLTKTGTFIITVFNPMPGGGTSNEKTFTVVNPNSSVNLSANAYSSGFMPSNFFEWLLLILIILLIIFLIRRMLKKGKITLTAEDITDTSVTMKATGLTPEGEYVFQLAGPLGTSKIHVEAGDDGKVSSSFSNLVPGSHYTGTLSKFDSHANFLSSAGAPTLYFDTFKQTKSNTPAEADHLQDHDAHVAHGH